jgi:Na+/proline symporter
VVLFPDLSHIEHGDTRAYPMVINAYLGPGIKGVVVTSFLAAYMSTIDTHLNWGASYITTDIYKRFIKKEASERHYMVVTKVAVVLLMLVAALAVPLVPSVSGGMEFYALMGIGVGLVSFFRWFWWRVSAWTELSILVTSAVLAAVMTLVTSLAPDLTVFGIAVDEMPFAFKFLAILPVTMAVALVVTYSTKPTEKAKLEEFYRRVRPGGLWSVVDESIRMEPGRALAPVTILHCLSGFALCFGISLGLGYAILHRPMPSLICFGVAAVGGAGVAHFVRVVEREFRQMGGEEEG